MSRVPVVQFQFEGPLETIYATLIVRLWHRGICKRAEIWSDGARFRQRWAVEISKSVSTSRVRAAACWN